MSNLDYLLFGLTVLSGLYWIGALICVSASARHPSAPSRFLPPVTVLKPLWSDDGRLYENLRTFCDQDYPAYQIVFGVRDKADPAVRVVHRLIREFPQRDLTLVVSDHRLGANLKIANLWNLSGHAKYETLVFADSDMHVGPDYLRAVVAPLEDRSVGLVTCLYKGVAPTGLCSTLGAMFINEWFYPSALVGAKIEPLRHAFGATIACRRDVLASVGGLEALADYLADDYQLGWLVSRRGLRVALSPYVVENVASEKSLASLFFHELRWTRTFRVVRPVSYFCSGVTYGIPLSLLFLLSTGLSRLAIGLFTAHVVLRCVGRVSVHRALGLPGVWSSLWLVPIRDGLSFILWVLSFMGRTVRWNDQRLRVDGEGRIRRDLPAAVEYPTQPVPLGIEIRGAKE